MKDLIGLKFNYLTVIEFAYKNKYGSLMFKCICDCGKYSYSNYNKLKTGHTKSCGCFKRKKISEIKKKHGQTINKKTSEYYTWCHLRARCYNKNDKRYKNYGGRGIKVCDRWLESFENFYADMGKKPSQLHSIDRIDVNGNYEPSNCRWATSKEQSQNTTFNKWYEFNGEKMIQKDWARKLNIDIRLFNKMIQRKGFLETYKYYNNKLCL